MSDASDLKELARQLNSKQKTSESTSSGIFSTMIVAALLAIPHAMLQGCTLWLLWGWFLVPLLPAINWHAAVGISYVLGVVNSHPTSESHKDTTRSSLLFKLVQSVVFCLIALAVGGTMRWLGFGFPVS